MQCESKNTCSAYCRSENHLDHVKHPRFVNVNQGKNWICIDCGKLDVYEHVRLQEEEDLKAQERIKQERLAVRVKQYNIWLLF